MTATETHLRRRRTALPLLAATAAAAAALTAPTGASAGVALSTSGWEWSDPSPQGYSLYDVQFAGPRGYAVGAGGTALRTDDGGATWSGLFTGTNTNATSIDVIGPDAIAIATGNEGNCSLRLSVDGGGTFKSFQLGDDDAVCSSSSFASFDFVSPAVGYVMRGGGAVLATNNGGETFGQRSAVDGGTSLRFVNDQTGFASSGNGKIYRTTDGAQTWNPIHDAGGPLSQIRALSPSTLIAWGENRLVRSVDGGATWTPGTIAGNPSRVSWADDNRLAFVSQGKLLLSDDGGVTMREVTLGNKDVLAVSYVDPTRIIAVGTGGVTYVSTDSGANFTRLSTDPIASGIGRINESNGGPIAIGTAGAIARLENGRWMLRQTLSNTAIVDADFSSAEKGYVLQEGNNLLQTPDNGKSWKRVDTGAPSEAGLVVAPNDSTVLLFGDFGVLRATNNGAFEKVDGKLVRKLRVLGARNAGNRVVTWSSKSKAKPVISADAGATWKAIELPKGIKRTSDLHPIPGKGLLLESGGRVFRTSSDTGKKWTEINSLGSSIGGDSPGITATSATEFFTGVDGDFGAPVVLHSTDAGATWQPQAIGASGTTVGSLAAAGPKTAYVLSTSNAPGIQSGLFSTTNGGTRGAGTTLSLDRTKSKLKRSGGKIQVVGQLQGGIGGEQVHVAIRKEGSSRWSAVNVIVGANGGGSFTASFSASKGKYFAVAQWAGDSGRSGSGTSAKKLTITK